MIREAVRLRMLQSSCWVHAHNLKWSHFTNMMKCIQLVHVLGSKNRSTLNIIYRHHECCLMKAFTPFSFRFYFEFSRDTHHSTLSTVSVSPAEVFRYLRYLSQNGISFVEHRKEKLHLNTISFQ